MDRRVFLFLSLFPSLAFAQALTWKSAVEQAGRNNSELKAAHSSVDSARESAKASRNGFFPALAGSLSYSYGTSSSSTNTDETADANYRANISLNQNVFNGLSDKAKLEQAEAQTRSQEASLESTKAKVSFDLKSAYANLLFAQSMVDLQGEIQKRREQNLKLVTLRFESGRENRGSVLLSRAYLDQAKYESLQARNNITTAQAQLARVLGRDEEVNFLATDEIPLVALGAIPNFKQLVASTPEHRSSVATEESADWGIKFARAGFFPTFSLNASSGKSGSDWFPQHDRWSVGASISIPLFDGGKDFYGTQAAISTWQAALATRANTDRSILEKLKTSYVKYQEATEKYKVDLSFKFAANKRAEIARGKYNNGLLTFDQWDIIENDLIARERATLQSQREQTTSEATWLQTQGRGVFP